MRKNQLQIEGHSEKQLAYAFQKCQGHKSLTKSAELIKGDWRDMTIICNAWSSMDSESKTKQKMPTLIKEVIGTIGGTWIQLYIR